MLGLRKVLIVVAILVVRFSTTYGQGAPTAGDCLGAYTVCQLTYDQPLSFSGQGNIANELPPDICLATGERNNAWYIITVQGPGRFGFTIEPNNSTADYDWAVFDLTNASCQDIYTRGSEILVKCNFTAMNLPTGATGMNDNIYGFVNGEEVQLRQNDSTIKVFGGEVFALVVNNYTIGDQGGYVLNLGVSTAEIIDTEPPRITNIEAPNCGATSINVSFSEYVKCSTVNASTFQLIGPGNTTVAISDVVGSNCLNGSKEKNFTIILAEPIFEGGNYTLYMPGAVEDYCGNVNPEDLSFSFSLPVISLSTSFTPVDCALNNGTATVSASGGAQPYTYFWEPGGQTSATAQGLAFGEYFVRVTDSRGCFARDSITVRDANNFSVEVDVETDICSFGVGGASARVNGGTPFTDPDRLPYNYFWNVVRDDNNLPSIDRLKTGTYELTVTDAKGCHANVKFLVPDFRYNLAPDFQYSPDTAVIPGIFPEVRFINQSEGAVSFYWDFGTGEYSSLAEPEYIFPGSGTYPVKLIVENEYACRDSITKDVTIAFVHTFFAPSAFSPNNDWLNDTFRIITTGIDTSTYKLYIFDRWGEEVFVGNHPREGWNGLKHNTGKPCSAGIYIYRVNFLDQSGKKRLYQGRITLLG